MILRIVIKILKYFIPRSVIAFFVGTLINTIDEKVTGQDPNRKPYKWLKKSIVLAILVIVAYMVVMDRIDLAKIITYFF